MLLDLDLAACNMQSAIHRVKRKDKRKRRSRDGMHFGIQYHVIIVIPA